GEGCTGGWIGVPWRRRTTTRQPWVCRSAISTWRDGRRGATPSASEADGSTFRTATGLASASTSSRADGPGRRRSPTFTAAIGRWKTRRRYGFLGERICLLGGT